MRHSPVISVPEYKCCKANFAARQFLQLNRRTITLTAGATGKMLEIFPESRSALNLRITGTAKANLPRTLGSTLPLTFCAGISRNRQLVTYSLLEFLIRLYQNYSWEYFMQKIKHWALQDYTINSPRIFWCNQGEISYANYPLRRNDYQNNSVNIFSCNCPGAITGFSCRAPEKNSPK